jgi:hypothetical protein
MSARRSFAYGINDILSHSSQVRNECHSSFDLPFAGKSPQSHTHTGHCATAWRHASLRYTHRNMGRDRGHIARQEGAHLSLTSPIHTHKHGEGGGTRSHRKRNSPSGIPNPREQNHDSGRRRLEAISSPFVEAAVRRSKRLLRRLACYATFVRAFLRARHWFSL